MPHTELKTESFDLYQGPDAPQEEDLYKCVHCGICLQEKFLLTGVTQKNVTVFLA